MSDIIIDTGSSQSDNVIRDDESPIALPAPAPASPSPPQRNPLHRGMVADPVVERSPPPAPPAQHNDENTSPGRARAAPVASQQNRKTQSGGKSATTTLSRSAVIPRKAPSMSEVSPPTPQRTVARVPASSSSTSHKQRIANADDDELQRLLVEKVAECHHKDELVFALQRHVSELEGAVADRAEFGDKMQMEVTLLQSSLRTTKTDLDAMKKCKTELDAVQEALVCFKVPAPSSRRNSPAGKQQQLPSVSNDVAALGRAFMALQLDVLRTFTWSAASIFGQWTSGVAVIANELEQEDRRRILVEFAVDSAALTVTREEQSRREALVTKHNSMLHRLRVSESLLAQHEKLLARGALELSTKFMSDFSALGALYHEMMRRAAAIKLRQANALVAKAREETEDKNKLLEESRKTMNLLKARFDATRRERAAVAALHSRSGRGGAQQQQQSHHQDPAADEQQQHQQQQPPAILQFQRHEVPTASSAGKARINHPFTIIDSPLPPGAAAAGSATPPPHSSTLTAAAVPAAGSRTPPPQQAATNPERRIVFLSEQRQQPQPQQPSSAAAATPASSSSDYHAQRLAEAIRQLEALHKKVAQLEEVLDHKDETIGRLRGEREELEMECEGVAAQCRLLEQACRVGARAAMEERCDIGL